MLRAVLGRGSVVTTIQVTVILLQNLHTVHVQRGILGRVLGLSICASVRLCEHPCVVGLRHGTPLLILHDPPATFLSLYLSHCLLLLSVIACLNVASFNTITQNWRDEKSE